MATELSNENKTKKDNSSAPLKEKMGKTVFLGIIFSLAVAIIALSIWYKNTFNVKFNDFLFTLLSPMTGTGKKTTLDIITYSMLPAVISLIPYGIFVYFTRREKTKRHYLLRNIGAVIVLTLFIFSLVFAFFVLRVPEFLAHYGEKTLIYEKKYIDPDTVAITDRDKNARNLIYIYLESVETTYASVEEGGAQNGVNYIPRLTAMAKDNVSFSSGEKLGGFRSVSGTSWTMGALLGTTSGVPLTLEIFGYNAHNTQDEYGTFLNGLTTLGDILEEKGYTNSFLIGSDAAFSDMNTFVSVHGNYNISDLHTAREQGYIPKKYHNGFWGFEDKYLYTIAKDRLSELSRDGKPFNFTMMTIDAHHTGGYLCDLCGNEYPTKLENVISCTDKQLYEFIEWCKEQDFYENTTIIITGDHPRMDNYLVKGIPFYERTVYNCIMNPATDIEYSDKNRVFTSLDMFPTTVAAIGFEIEGDRLGLGTNLFSDLPTLCEEMGDGEEGYNLFDTEVKKFSEYYKSHFIQKDKNFT